jgi:hypothetical protein
MTKAAIVSLLIACAMVSKIDAHAVPTHAHITRAAVDFLRKVDGRFACSSTLNDLLQVGTAAEDDTPRFMFHFNPNLNDSGYFGSCNSTEWGFGSAACRQSGGAPLFAASTLTNSHRWSDAVARARDAQGNPAEQGWNELGFVLHLLEDLTSPAHTRNDAHPPYMDGDPMEARTRTPAAPGSSEGLVSLGTPEAYFSALQGFTQSNFYSSDTAFSGVGPAAARSDRRYFYDARGRRIAYKGLAYLLSGATEASRNPRQATIDETIAAEQFAELGPVAVQYAASLIRHYFDAANPKLTGCFVDFEQFSGSSVFSSVQPPLSAETATFTGGQILANTAFLPVDRTSVYGTAFFCSGCLPTITIDFEKPIDGVSFLLMNGQTFTVTYTVVDDQGGSRVLSLPANSDSGAAVVDLKSKRITQVKVTSNAGNWDFFIDNVRFGGNTGTGT